MALRNPGGPPGIGKRWPYKALNFLPERRLWDYLRSKSGSYGGEEPFRLGTALSGCKRILIALPEGLQENLVAFPVIRSLVRERPDTVFHFIAEQELTAFLAALLGHDRVAGIRREDLYWGEPHFLELRRVTEEFRPDISINLREWTPPLLHFILRAARAPIRVQAGEEGPQGFSNIALRPASPSNRLRRHLQVAALWDMADTPIPVKWARLAPGPENLKEAHSRLEAAGARPDRTRLFLWQHGNSHREHEAFRQAKSEFALKGDASSLVIINGSGPLFGTPPPPPEVAGDLPVLSVDSTGAMLGLFASTPGSIGVNGPLLHLASLADTDVQAYFSAADREWDTSALNSRMRVVYEPDAAQPSGPERAF